PAESPPVGCSQQDFWSGHIGRMRMAVEQAALLSLPAEKELTVMETPKFERGAIPQAGYIPAPPLEKKSRAFFCFTPGLGQDEETGPANNAEGYSEYQAMLTVIRELYPGRHTLLTACRPVGAGALYLPPQLVLENGWCKYVCELLLENRLIREPDLKMLIYHEHLVDAHRVLADIRLHCGGIDEDRAIADLVESTGMSEQAARFEVRKLAGSPTASVGAMLGRIQIRKLRNEYKKKTGEEFSLRRFHDRFLELCWLPLAVLRRRLIE
ncbi:MAG: DUF885 family protein, partial [Gemmatimonadota bacterium]|nr:DUF885 family protein [Gemmatimonadota bacterium]